MCAFDKDSAAAKPSRRRAALIPALLSVFVSTWLLLVPKHGGSFASNDVLLGLGVGVAVGVGIVALVRNRC